MDSLFQKYISFGTGDKVSFLTLKKFLLRVDAGEVRNRTTEAG
jgi:hypothetical protein